MLKHALWCHQDVIIVNEDLQKLSQHADDVCKWSLYCVCDGHGGRAAAKFMEDNLASEMARRLPAGCPPPLVSPG